MIHYQWTSTIIGVGIAACILYLVRRDRLHGPYAVWWLLVAAGGVLLGLFPRIIDHLATLLGVNYPPVLALTLGLGMVLIKMLTMDIHRTNQERKLRRLAQRLAMLETSEHQPPAVTESAIGERPPQRGVKNF